LPSNVIKSHWISAISRYVEFLNGSRAGATRDILWRIGLSGRKSRMSGCYLMDSLTGKSFFLEAVGLPEIVRFSHVDLIVADCDRVVQWWQDVLGVMLL
jgi:hypothetical protein